MLKNLDWYQFEKLVGLLYTQEGYRVDRKGGAGADGGVASPNLCGQYLFARTVAGVPPVRVPALPPLPQVHTFSSPRSHSPTAAVAALPLKRTLG